MTWTDTVVRVRRFLGCWSCVRRRPESVRRIGCPHRSASRSLSRDDQEFGRAIGFFDATYALALTLLVTTLDIAEPSSAWATLPALWDAVGPQFLAFGISFAVISSYGLAHHRLVRTLAAVDQLTIIANLVLVTSIVVIPFSTNAVGDPGVEDLPLPTAFLAVNIAIASGLHTLVYMLAYRRKLFVVRPSAREVQGAIIIGLSVGVIVLASVPVAYLASPVIAQLCWLLIIPIRVVARRWAADSTHS